MAAVFVPRADFGGGLPLCLPQVCRTGFSGTTDTIPNFGLGKMTFAATAADIVFGLHDFGSRMGGRQECDKQ